MVEETLFIFLGNGHLFVDAQFKVPKFKQQGFEDSA